MAGNQNPGDCISKYDLLLAISDTNTALEEQSTRRSARKRNGTKMPTDKMVSNLSNSANGPTGQHGALAGTPESLLPSDITSFKTKRYKINHEKALTKKLSASNQNELYVCEKVGDGVNIHFQAGLFEFFRMAACRYYSDFHVTGLAIEVLIQLDKESAIVQSTFRAKAFSGHTSYLLDVYHTSSSIRISGRSQARFFDQDWHCIGDLISEMESNSVDATSTNSVMKQCLEAAISEMKKPKQDKAKQHNHRQILEEDLLPLLSSCTEPEAEGVDNRQDEPTALALGEPPTQTDEPSSDCDNRDKQLTNEAAIEEEREPMGHSTPITQMQVTSDQAYVNQLQHHDNASSYMVSLPQRLTPTREQMPSREIEAQATPTGEQLASKEREIISREIELENKERRLNTLQRELAKKEKELASKEVQQQALRSTLTHLERKTNELKEENQLLSAKVLALERDQQPTPTGNHTRQEHQQNYNNCQQNCNSCQASQNSQAGSSPGMPQIIIAPNFGSITPRDSWNPVFASGHQFQPHYHNYGLNPHGWTQQTHPLQMNGFFNNSTWPGWIPPQPPHPHSQYSAGAAAARDLHRHTCPTGYNPTGYNPQTTFPSQPPLSRSQHSGQLNDTRSQSQLNSHYYTGQPLHERQQQPVNPSQRQQQPVNPSENQPINSSNSGHLWPPPRTRAADLPPHSSTPEDGDTATAQCHR